MKKSYLNKTIATFMIGGIILTAGTITVVAKATNSKAKVTTPVKVTAPAKIAPSKPATNTALQTGLDGLVKKKTITKAQETKVLAVLNTRKNFQRGQNRPVGQNGQNLNNNKQNNNFQNMTDAQRKALMQSRTNQRPDQLAALVKAKTITQAQANAINKIVAATRTGFRNTRPQNSPPKN